MTRSTSSRSVKATPKTEPEPDINGTPPPDPLSATIFGGSTHWYVTTEDGEVLMVTLPGRGRISWSRAPHRAGAEVRFYRDATTKVFDAVIPDVVSAHSDIVTVAHLGKSTSAEKLEMDKKANMDRVASVLLKRIDKIAAGEDLETDEDVEELFAIGGPRPFMKKLSY